MSMKTHGRRGLVTKSEQTVTWLATSTASDVWSPAISGANFPAGRVNQMTLSSVKPSQFQPLVPPTGAAPDWRVRFAIELMTRKPASPVRDIASRLNLSQSRLRHLFTAELGVSPSQYLRRSRLEYARDLFGASSLSVKEVAVIVGFNDVSHFVRDYKAAYGQTPGQARQTQKDFHRVANPANE